MSQNSVGLNVLQENTAFPFFFYPIYATLLLEARALEMRASAIPHMIIALPFVAFASVGYLRYRRYIATKSESRRSQRPQSTRKVGTLDAVRFAVMLITGYVFGQSAFSAQPFHADLPRELGIQPLGIRPGR